MPEPKSIDLHLDLDNHGTETDAAHGLVDVAAALAEHHWRGSALYEQIEAISQQIEATRRVLEAPLKARGISDLDLSDHVGALLCAYDALARDTARFAFALAHTLQLAHAASFDDWMGAAEQWLEANNCGGGGHQSPLPTE